LAELTVKRDDVFDLKLCRSADGNRAIHISYEKGELDVDGVKIPFVLSDKEASCKIHVFRDHSVLEAFVNEQICAARAVYPEKEDCGLSLSTPESKITVKSLDIWELKPIW
jgi:sucrose-6-phosphate hydrolase SacC (GH32 family)